MKINRLHHTEQCLGRSYSFPP